MFEPLRLLTMLLPAFVAVGFFIFHWRTCNPRLLFFVTVFLTCFGIESVLLPFLYGLTLIPIINSNLMGRSDFRLYMLLIRAVLLLLLAVPFLYWVKKPFQKSS